MSEVLKRVQQTIEESCQLSPGDRVVVGVSGGPDSLCLLHVLCRLRGRYGLELYVGHLHHGLRGADADEDAEFVRSLAADWNLPCAMERVDVPALASEHRLAVEEAARRARYAFLRDTARRFQAQAVAVGHNADDQAETVLMHFLRGSGLAGLRGMLPCTRLGDYRLLDAPNAPELAQEVQSQVRDLMLLRPLLEVSRAEIEAYCDYYGLAPRFDRSNLDVTYFRNWLRHEVIPLLSEHNPNVQGVMRRSARVLADDHALLRTLLEETWLRVVVMESEESIAFDLEKWRALPTSLKRSTLREGIHRLRKTLRNINFLHVENALRVARDGTTGDQATLPRNLMLSVGYDRLTMADASAADALPDWPLLPPESGRLEVSVPGDVALPGSEWLLRVEVVGRSDLPAGWKTNADPWRAYLDAVLAGGPLWLRTRRPGDRFQPLGQEGHTAKLADFFTNRKVPRRIRDHVPLLVGEWGIAWVCGQRIDERFRVGDATETALVLEFVRR